MSTTNQIRDISEVTEDKENGLIFEKNVSIPLKASGLPVRANVYRPIAAESSKFPVLVTYGPYGKDIPYDKYDAQRAIEAINEVLLINLIASLPNLSVRLTQSTRANTALGKLLTLSFGLPEGILWFA
jgi:hypothetical protein